MVVLFSMAESRSCKNCYRYLTGDPVFIPKLDGKRTALSQAQDPCWKSQEMDGCSEHFFERPTRFDRILRDDDA